MNRVLSWPQSRIAPGLLKPLKSGRTETVVTERRSVHFDLPLGSVEMGFLTQHEQLEPGTRVYVWWKGGGFVCAPVDEVEAEERASRAIEQRLEEARARLETGRRERLARDSALSDFDALTPPPASGEHPLLQTGR